MAQIQVNVDTESKTVSLTIDGASIPNIEDVHLYSYRDSNGNVTGLDISMETSTKEENGVRKRVSYYAMASAKAKMALASSQKVYNDVKGFVGVDEQSQVAKEIDEFLSSKSRSH